jgi:hypothetical protein
VILRPQVASRYNSELLFFRSSSSQMCSASSIHTPSVISSIVSEALYFFIFSEVHLKAFSICSNCTITRKFRFPSKNYSRLMLVMRWVWTTSSASSRLPCSKSDRKLYRSRYRSTNFPRKMYLPLRFARLIVGRWLGSLYHKTYKLWLHKCIKDPGYSKNELAYHSKDK